MLKLTILLVLVAVAAAQKRSFDNYKVFRVVPKTAQHVDFLKQFGEFRDNEVRSFCIIGKST